MTTCRHCAREIHRLGDGGWVDVDGFACCVKGGLWRDPITDKVCVRPPVEHQPMPPALTGGRS